MIQAMISNPIAENLVHTSPRPDSSRAMAAAAAAAACNSFAVLPAHHYRPLSPPRFSPKSPSCSLRSFSGPEVGRAVAAAAAAGAVLAGLTLAAPLAYGSPFDTPAALPVLQEPENALSLPTWAIHVSSVAEWILAMSLVWEYGEKSGFQAWKGLSWGMVPLLGGAMCACTWHFFYNSELLEILVAIQAALTVIGNTTMAVAAFRIFRASKAGSKNS